MLELVDYNEDSALVITGNEMPPTSFLYKQIDLAGKTVQEAFLLGMAHSLYNNRGIPLPEPVPTMVNSSLESEDI